MFGKFVTNKNHLIDVEHKLIAKTFEPLSFFETDAKLLLLHFQGPKLVVNSSGLG
jgi:hypothetical protein